MALSLVAKNFSKESVTPTVNATETPGEEMFLEKMAVSLNVYYTPVLIILGCIGNAMSIIVFFKSKLRLQSTSQYLSALALSDTIFLCQLVPPWLKAVGISTLFSRHGYCQIFVYLSYVTCNHSSWLVVAFTVERLMAVVYPLRRNSMCTVKRARHIIAWLALGALLVNAPVLRFAVPNNDDCNIDVPLIRHAARFNMVDTVVSFTLPLVLIVALNIWIMIGVYREARQRGDLMVQQEPDLRRGPQLQLLSVLQRAQQRITKMLLIVSSVFVVLNMPAYTMRIVAYAKNMGEKEYSGKWAAVQQVCLLCFNTNFGINFFLYCLTGQNFRRALEEVFPCLRRNRFTAYVLRGTNATEPNARGSSLSTSFVYSFGKETSTSAISNSEPRPSVENRICNARPFGNHEDLRTHLEEYRMTRPIRQRRARRVLSAFANRDCEDYDVPRNIPARVNFNRRPQQEQNVIQRWRFDNSRQQQQRVENCEFIEMQDLSGGNMHQRRENRLSAGNMQQCRENCFSAGNMQQCRENCFSAGNMKQCRENCFSAGNMRQWRKIRISADYMQQCHGNRLSPGNTQPRRGNRYSRPTCHNEACTSFITKLSRYESSLSENK